MPDADDVRMARISADLAKTAEHLAQASAPLALSAPAASARGVATDMQEPMMEIAETTSRSAPAVAELAADLAHRS
jgi:hypothetical protein